MNNKARLDKIEQTLDINKQSIKKVYLISIVSEKETNQPSEIVEVTIEE